MENQTIREKAINIFADIFTAGGEAHEVGGQSFDQLQQSGYIDRKITDITAIISEHYYTKEFVIALADWLLKLEPTQRVSVWSKNGEYKGLFTMDGEQLLDKFKERVWKENERC